MAINGSRRLVKILLLRGFFEPLTSLRGLMWRRVGRVPERWPSASVGSLG
jgi:hypothetical protein